MGMMRKIAHEAPPYLAVVVCVLILFAVRSYLDEIKYQMNLEIRTAVTEAIAGRIDIMSWTKKGTSPDGDIEIVTVQGRPDPSHPSVPSNESEADALDRHRDRIAAVEALYTSGLTWTN